MSTNIFDISKERVRRAKREVRGRRIPPKPRVAQSTTELLCEAHEDVIGEWQIAARSNKLSDYIASKLPSTAKVAGSAVNYAEDLNALSIVEQKLDMKVSIFYPETTDANMFGWMTAFHIDGHAYSIGINMATEAYARAFGILLYLQLTKILTSLGRA